MISTKSLIVVFIVNLIVSNINAESCFEAFNTQCVGENQVCDTSTGYDFCNKGLYCDNTSNKCLKILNPGEACTNQNQCGPYQCFNNICQDAHYGYLGDACEFDFQCEVSDSYCNNQTKKCTSVTATCPDSLHCPFTQYCKDGVCVDRLKIGDQCGSGQGPCPRYSLCIENNAQVQVCTERYTKNEGDLCSDIDQCNPDDDLVCGSSGKCVKGASTSFTPSSYNCNSTGNECQSFETCICHNREGDGECFEVGTLTDSAKIKCYQATKSFVECATENQCMSFDISPMSCAFTNCAEEYCEEYSACYPMPDYGFESGCGPFVGVNDICTYLGPVSSSSSILIPLMSIIAFISMILL